MRYDFVPITDRPIEVAPLHARVLENLPNPIKFRLPKDDRHSTVGTQVPRYGHEIAPDAICLKPLLGGNHMVNGFEKCDPAFVAVRTGTHIGLPSVSTAALAGFATLRHAVTVSQRDPPEPRK
jgi:hypothetical protein